jgi:hypothetical protein
LLVEDGLLLNERDGKTRFLIHGSPVHRLTVLTPVLPANFQPEKIRIA